MTSPLDAILALPRAFDRCNGTFALLADVYGNQVDAENEPEPSRTVTLVWLSPGIIGNGGFEAMLGSDVPGDAGFIHTVASYRRIGAMRAYSAFVRALSMFPDNTPPEDLQERRQLLEEFMEGEMDEAEDEFYAADAEVEACLDAFITTNADGLGKLIATTEVSLSPHPENDGR